MTEWSAEDWEEWRAENLRILSAGGSISTVIATDGSVEAWAELDGKRWRRDPQWIRDKDENYLYG